MSEGYTSIEPLIRVINELNGQGIIPLFIKAIDPHIPTHTNNVDVLVPYENLHQVIKVLKRFNYMYITSAKEENKLLFRSYQPPYDRFPIHLHIKIGWEGFEFLAARDALSNSIKVNIYGTTVLIPKPELALFINIVHDLYENKKISQTTLTLYNYLFHLYGSKINDFLETYGKKYGVYRGIKEFQGILISSKLEDSKAVPLYRVIILWLEKIHHDSKSFFDFLVNLSKISSRFLKRRLPLINRRRIIIIALSGPDGSGKTTHSVHITRALQLAGFDTEYVWSRGLGWISGTRISLKVYQRIKFSHSLIEKYNDIKILKVLKAIAILLDHWLQILFLLFKKTLFKKNIVVLVFDRFLDDSIVDTLLLYNSPRVISIGLLLLKSLPQPVHVYLFSNRCDRLQLFHYINLFKHYFSNRVYVLSSDGEENLVRNRIMSIFLKELYSRI